MHSALPLRKPSNPRPFLARTTRLPTFRRSRVKTIAIFACAVGFLFYIFSYLIGSERSIPAGTPPVVIVTVLDPVKYSKLYLENIKENRIKYAQRHGYATMFPITTDYDLRGAPDSWSHIPATRHALSKYPDTTFFWYLDQNAFIMNPKLSIQEHVMDSARLEKIMLKEQSIVPPSSVIKTFSHLKGANIDLVITQDDVGLAPGSFIVRRSDWTKFFLDTWFDPLYRSYNFQRAEVHALEHIVQWHPTILSKLAIVPQRILNAYSRGFQGDSGVYQKGDLTVVFTGCDVNISRDCVKEADALTIEWRKTFAEE